MSIQRNVKYQCHSTNPDEMKKKENLEHLRFLSSPFWHIFSNTWNISSIERSSLYPCQHMSKQCQDFALKMKCKCTQYGSLSTHILQLCVEKVSSWHLSLVVQWGKDWNACAWTYIVYTHRPLHYVHLCFLMQFYSCAINFTFTTLIFSVFINTIRKAMNLHFMFIIKIVVSGGEGVLECIMLNGVPNILFILLIYMNV